MEIESLFCCEKFNSLIYYIYKYFLYICSNYKINDFSGKYKQNLYN